MSAQRAAEVAAIMEGETLVHFDIPESVDMDAEAERVAFKSDGVQPLKIAIIGSGSAALGAAYALKFTNNEVHIFEQDSRLGGHTNTQTWTSADNQSTPVDTGFIVMNEATYPNFKNFLRDVKVDTKVTEMSFAVSRDRGKFEWSGSLKGLFAQRRNIFRLSHWRMIFDIIRFEQYAPDLLRKDDGAARTITIGQYLDREGYSRAFKDNYLIPMTAAVWSTSPDKASLEFPAQTLIRFMWNHHLLSTVSSRPDWLTIPGGSQKYIDAIIKSYKRKSSLRLHRSAKVVGVSRWAGVQERPVKLHWVTDEKSHSHPEHMLPIEEGEFHHVIFACHGDQVLPILTGQRETRRDSKTTCLKSVSETPIASTEEQKIFSAFKTTANECYLHSDLSLMPKRRGTWSSWNYLIESSPSAQPHPAGVSLTYNMNILQHIPTDVFDDVLVTMNPKVAPKAELTQGHYTYRHPLYTVEAIQAQEKLERLQNKRGVSFCGAWTKYGFHEDGFSSGLKVAMDHLGAKLPFEFTDSTYSRGHVPPPPTLLDYVLRIVLSVALIYVRTGEWLLRLPGVSLLVAVLTFFPIIMLDLMESSGVFA